MDYNSIFAPYYAQGRKGIGYFNNADFQRAMQNTGPLGSWMTPGQVVMDVYPDKTVKHEVGGGKTRTDVRFAIRVAQTNVQPQDQGYITKMDEDGGFHRGGNLYDAYLFNTADDAAKAVARRNATISWEPRQYVIVPVTLATVTPKVQITTTETPAKTVYRLRVIGAGYHVEVMDNGRFRYHGPATKDNATNFETAGKAANSIENRGKIGQWGIELVKMPGEKKVERSTIAGGTTTRSL